MRSPRPFLTILEYCKQSKSEAGEGLGTRLCILFAVYTSNPACCQDPVFQFLNGLVPKAMPFATSSDSYSHSIPLAHGVFGHCIALDSQADQDLDQQRHSAGSSAKNCAPWLAFSRAKGRSAAELEEERVECAGWLCTLGCKSGCSTIVIQELCEIYPGIGRMKGLARSCVWWPSSRPPE